MPVTSLMIAYPCWLPSASAVRIRKVASCIGRLVIRKVYIFHLYMARPRKTELITVISSQLPTIARYAAEPQSGPRHSKNAAQRRGVRRMADTTRPPFRADHVGSLLRPKEVLQARDEFTSGEISAEQLAQIEDEAIREIIRKQGEVGLKSATDGELRRQSWHMDFIYQLGGIEQVNDDLVRVAFHNKDKTYEYAPPSAHVTEPVSLPDTIFADAFSFVRDNASAGQTPKLTIPSPSMVH